MAKPLIYTSAGAASEPSSESYGVLEAPEGVLLYLVAAADDAADPGRIHRAASDRIEQSFREQPLDDPRRFLTRLVGDVNAALFAIGRGEENGGLHASVACLFHAEGRVSYVHVGNARLYVLRDGVIQQITQDHTQAQQMVDQALLKPQEARGHPFSKVVLRTLGKKPIIEVTVQGPHPVKEGDHYILCSPGLVEKLRDDEIGNGLVAGDVAEAVNRLCRAAETRGGAGRRVRRDSLRRGRAFPRDGLRSAGQHHQIAHERGRARARGGSDVEQSDGGASGARRGDVGVHHGIRDLQPGLLRHAGTAERPRRRAGDADFHSSAAIRHAGAPADARTGGGGNGRRTGRRGGAGERRRPDEAGASE
ncbi:MAG: hypothetical protein M5R36_09655 [Deltaproteobacteria bacterium]|nr:hypothetical protein [Deltaproteobacteria bacterium]